MLIAIPMRWSVRGKAVAPRLRRFGGDVLMSRDERAEGLEVNYDRRPRQEIDGRRSP